MLIISIKSISLKKFYQKIFSRRIIILFLFIICTYFFNLPLKLINKSRFYINNLKKSSLIKASNCSLNSINKIPNSSTIVIGHLYGSPSNHNNFIDKKAQEFLLENKLKIKNLFLTGDIFHTPSKEKWNKLFTLLGDDINIIIAPGNHDIGSLSSQKTFNISIKQSKVFPITFQDDNNVYIFENSIKSGWHIKENIFNEINKINKRKNVFLLRHNIGVKELILFANSRDFLENDLSNFNKINQALERDIIIISGDGGAFKDLPRLFCIKNGKVKYIINGLGGVKEDSILIIKNNQIFKYILN